MRPQELNELLQFGITNNFPILIKGRPGIGKSDIVAQAAAAVNADLIISHPVVSDPTDYKGLPFSNGTEAKFLPFSELNQLISAQKKTVFFLDDLGQAPAAVQAAVMQLLLARRINEHKISDEVCFLAATNRKEDKAAVNGILEPVKSRFASIVELEASVEDWVKWALVNNMPVPLISFARYRPEVIEKGESSKDIVNTTSPRTVAFVGKLQNAGIPAHMEYEVFKGAAGEAFAGEYKGFLQVFRDLPDIDGIIMSPRTAKVPEEAAVLYALTGALAARATQQNIGNIIEYLDRLSGELAVATLKDAVIRDSSVTQTKAYIQWSVKNSNVII